MFVHFRKRFSVEELNRVNEATVSAERVTAAKDDFDHDLERPGSPESSGARVPMHHPHLEATGARAADRCHFGGYLYLLSDRHQSGQRGL